MTAMRQIAILGATGSIGGSTLDVIAQHPDRFRASVLTAHRNVAALAEQLNSFGLGRGDRIALVMNNGPELIVSFFAAAMCGTATPRPIPVEPSSSRLLIASAISTASCPVISAARSARSSNNWRFVFTPVQQSTARLARISANSIKSALG